MTDTKPPRPASKRPAGPGNPRGPQGAKAGGAKAGGAKGPYKGGPKGAGKTWTMRAPKLPGPGDGRVRLYGRHPVEAALQNPNRRKYRLTLAEQPEGDFARLIADSGVPVAVMPKTELDRLVGAQAVHQGMVLECEQLEELDIDSLLFRLEAPFVLIALDRVTDPQNIGAVLRSAEVFGARAVIGTLRHSAPETGALAKTASGALERQPYLRVTNLSDAMVELREMGFVLLGLDGAAETTVAAAVAEAGSRPIALVMGAEGPGLREKTRETCDRLVRIAPGGEFGSLNVSNAAAVALYAVSQR